MRRLQLLTALLSAAAMAVAASLTLSASTEIASRELFGLLLFLAMNVLAESKPLHLPGPKGEVAEITISGLCSYALVALFEPLHAAVTGASAVLITEAFIKRKSALKSSFNTTQTFLSLALAAVVHGAIMGFQVGPRGAQVVLAMTCTVLTYFVTNTTLVGLGLSCLRKSSFWRTRVANYRWEVLYVVCSIPLAILLMVAYERLWIAGPVLFLAPLFLLRESYAQYIRLKTNYTETVRTLVKVIETHDSYTAGHSLRVAEYSKRLACALKLSTREVEKIEIAAYLHDLGKVHLAITDLVRKTGPLTAEERMRIQLHPVVSADLAAQVTVFRGEIEAMIRHHHEHHNGTGYPHGLSGLDIPLGARILHIADAFDAMTSSRVYRGALDLERVRQEFRTFAGVHFDPAFVTVFLETCVPDEAAILPQVEPAIEELLSGRPRPAASRPAPDAGRPGDLQAAYSCLDGVRLVGSSA